jgi:hypothetical protein
MMMLGAMIDGKTNKKDSFVVLKTSSTTKRNIALEMDVSCINGLLALMFLFLTGHLCILLL